MKIIKYILGVLFICSGLGYLFTGEPVGILLLILGVIILPVISKYLKQRFSKWNSKIVRYCTYVVIFLTIAMIKKPSSGNYDLKKSGSRISLEEKYSPYFNKYSNLSKENDSIRKLIIDEMQSNQVYQKLVNDSVVTVEFIPVLNGISNGITYLKEDEFFVDPNIRDNIANSHYGQEGLKFFPQVIALARPKLGGIPEKIVAVFERYKDHYGMYGGKQAQFKASGKIKKEAIETPFDFTPFFAMINSDNEEVLESLYEAKQLDINSWRENGNYAFSYISTLDGFIDYLISNYPYSDLLPDDYDAQFWKKYDKIVRVRILRMIFLKDCSGLQNEFNTTSDNLEKLQKTGKDGSRNFALMDFLDENMRRIGCYD